MRVSIVTDDRTVVVDGEGLPIDDDMATLRNARVTAVQWYGDFGEREFESVFLRDEKRWHREPNEIFADPAEVLRFVEHWKLAKAKKEAAEAEVEAKRQERLRLIGGEHG